MGRDRVVISTTLAMIWLADAVLCWTSGLSFSHWSPALPSTMAIAIIGLGYHWSGRSVRIADLAHWTGLWVAFSIVGAILTYLAARHGAAWSDDALAALDHRFGFDWSAWFEFVGSHHPLKLVLAVAYASLMPQILGSVLYFAYRGWEDRNSELLSSVTLALLLTCGVFALFPAFGPGTAVPQLADLYLADLVGLHDGSVAVFEIAKLKGIIAFPSFHAVLGVLFTYAHRGRASFYPVAALNAVMLVSIPSEGGHYLIDALAGVAIALLTIVAIRGLQLHRVGTIRARLAQPGPA